MLTFYASAVQYHVLSKKRPLNLRRHLCEKQMFTIKYLMYFGQNIMFFFLFENMIRRKDMKDSHGMNKQELINQLPKS